MSLLIRNLQRAIPIRRVPLRKNIEQIRRILGVQQFDLGVICVNNRHIQLLNRNYRWKDSPTDVLSFPFHEVNILLTILQFSNSLMRLVLNRNKTIGHITKRVKASSACG